MYLTVSTRTAYIMCVYMRGCQKRGVSSCAAAAGYLVLGRLFSLVLEEMHPNTAI